MTAPPTSTPVERKTVVIAEDESLIRMDLEEILQESGYDVLAACGRADDALELVRTLRPDVAVLDIRMPGGDGLAVARLLTAERVAAVVMLTSYSMTEMVNEATEAGVHGYVVKPFQGRDVVAAIEVAHSVFTASQSLVERAERAEKALETRKLLDRAKGHLQDSHQMSESDAFRFIQRAAMAQRAHMSKVAQQVLAGTLTPEE